MIVDVLAAVAVTVVVGRQLALLAAAGLRGRPGSPPVDTDVTVVIPAWQEEGTIARSVRGALACRGVAEVIVVDDGSTDRTAPITRASAASDGRVRLLRHEVNAGKAAALNTGLRAARTALVACVDADTVPAPDAIARLAGALSDPTVAAAAGNVRVAGSGWLARWQALEYVTALHLGRRAQALFGCMVTVPGAIGVWRRDAVLAAGGFSGDTLAEDTDLTLALQRAGHGVRLVDDAIAWTRTPETLAGLFRQRRRWLYGNLQCLYRHRHAFQAGPAPLARVALPDLLFTHGLVYLLLPVSVAWLAHAPAHFSVPQILAIGAALLALDLLGTAIAWRAEGLPARALLEAPLQRLLAPFFLQAVFVAVCVYALSGRPVPWRRMVPAGAAR